MNLRTAVSPLLALAAFVPVVAACGAPAESEGASESSQAALSKDLVCPINSPLPQCKPVIPSACYAETPECTTGPGSWAEATPQGLNPTTRAEDAAWVSGMIAAGCTTPTAYDPNIYVGVGMYVTTCPVPISELPPLPPDMLEYAGASTYAQLELGCNACFLTLPPAGTVRLAWDPSSARPGGCKMGSCSSTQ